MIKQKGFSLMEVMIAITIIGVIGIISVNIFTQTLRTSSETESLSNLKQNGEQVVNSLTEAIRSAEAVVCYGPPDNTYLPPDNTRKNRMVIRTADGKYIKFRFVDPIIGSDGVTGNGYLTKQEGLDPEQLAAFCSADTASPGIVALSNNNSLTGVSISEGKFVKISGSQNKDTIAITFKVNPALKSGGTLGSDIAVMQATVQVR